MIEKYVDWDAVVVPKCWYNEDGTLNVGRMNEYIKKELAASVERTEKWQKRMILLGVPEKDTMGIIEMFG